MDGVIGAAVVWAVGLLAIEIMWRRNGWFSSLRLSREAIALMILLLGTKAVATGTSADEVVENPVILERITRGGLTVLAGLIILPSLFAVLRSRFRSRVGIGVLLAWAYLLVAGMSTLYSAARVVTLGKVVELGVAVVIVSVTAMQVEPQERLKRLLLFTLFLEGMLVASSVLGFFALPGLFASVQPRPGFIFQSTMVAPFAHNNVLAASAGGLAGFTLASGLTISEAASRRWWLAATGILTIGVVLASGRQGVVIWLATVGLVLFCKRLKLFLFMIVPAAVLMAGQYWDTIWRAVNRDALYDLRTFTGRLSWWEASIDTWAAHPWTGYGFGAGGRFVALTSVGANVANVHNGYLEGLLGVGLLGMIPLILMVAVVISWSAKRIFTLSEDFRYSILFVPFVIHTMVDLGFGAWLKPDFIVMAILAALAGTYRTKPYETRLEAPVSSRRRDEVWSEGLSR